MHARTFLDKEILSNTRGRYNLMRILVAAFIALLAFEATNCKDNGTAPSPPNGPDTTSRDFTISTQEFGDGAESQAAFDAWVFGPNNIWVGGWFGTVGAYNNVTILQWNGTNWIPRVSDVVSTSSGIYGIWALDTSTIYFADVSIAKYKNGQFYQQEVQNLPFQTGQKIKHVWAASESNVWAVGDAGCVVHYDGSTWSKIDFDTQFQFMAVTGSVSTGIAFATARNIRFNTLIVRLEGTTAETIFQGGDQLNPQSIEFMKMRSDHEILLSGETIRSFNTTTLKMDTLFQPTMYMGPIGYAAWNDVFFFLDYQGGGRMVHYNGQSFAEFALPARPDVYLTWGASAHAGVAVSAGMSSNKALLTIVRRRMP